MARGDGGSGRNRWAVVATISLAVAVAGGMVWWLLVRERADDAARVGDGPAASRDRLSGTSHAAADHPAPGWFAQSGTPPHRIAGRVFAGADPLGGARVELHSPLTDAGVWPVAVARTDVGGRFDFGDRPAGRFRVVATAPERAPTAVAVNLADPLAHPAADELELYLAECQMTLSGTVEDISGGPIEGARLRLEASGLSTTTDDRGHYQACLRIGARGVLVATADGYADQQASVPALGDQRVSFQLSPDAIVVGRVVDAITQEPVPFARVSAMSFGASLDGTETVANAAGEFRAAGLAPARYRFTAHADRGTSPRPVEVIATVGGGDPVTLEITEGWRLEGRVLDRGDQAVPGVRVHVNLMGLASVGYYESVVSQADGRFELDGVPGATVRIGSTPESDREDELVSLENGELVTLRVGRMGSLRGRVTRDGKPVGGIGVSARSEGADGGAATTLRDGTYAIRNLPAGTYKVGAAGSDAFTRGTDVTLAEGEDRRDVDLDLDLAATVRGQLVDQDDRPIEGATVVLELGKGDDWGFGLTGSDGAFVARAMSGGGAYAVKVRLGGSGQRSPDLPAAQGQYPTIQVADGHSQVEGVRLVARFDRLAIEGVVRFADGEPAPDVSVTARSLGADFRSPESRVRTRSDGRFRIAPLVAGRFNVTAEVAYGSRAGVEGVAAGTTDLALELDRAGSLEGRVEGFSGKISVRACTKSYQCASAQVRQGHFRIDPMAPGEYEVVAGNDVEAVRVTATVRAGETTSVSLASTGVATVTGTVHNVRDRSPMSGLSCGWRVSDSMIAAGQRSTNVGADGTFTLAVPAGQDLEIGCSSMGKALAATEPASIRVERGETATVDLPGYQTRYSFMGNPSPGTLGLAVDPWQRIIRLTPDGPAAKAGLREGDRVVEVEGVSTTGFGRLTSLMLSDYAAGDTASLAVRREQKQIDVRVVAEPAPRFTDW